MMSLALVNLLLLIFSIVVDSAASLEDRAKIHQVYPPHSDVDTNGKFLRVVMLHLPPELIVTRNSTGHVIEVGGVGMLVLEWLSHALNFKFDLFPDNIYSVEDNAAGKGLMSWLLEGRADLILGPITFSAVRYKRLNYAYPFIISQDGLLIPMPSAQINVAAVWKPFQSQVWICFLVSLFATTTCLYGISYGISVFFGNKDSKNKTKMTEGKIFEDFGQAWKYVMGVVLSQSITAQKETARDQKLTIRILAGTWCLTCFVIVTAYSSVLISFVTSPYYKPLLDSIYDFPKDPNVKITVDRGLFPDLLFTTAEDGIYKYLGDQLRREPDLRCSTTEQCLNKVRNGSHAYTQGDHTLKSLVGIARKRSGRCDFTIAKERFFSFCAGLALPKQTEVEYYNRGMLKAHEGGFIVLWYDRVLSDATRCLNVPRQHESERIRLGLGGLSGAFVVLGFGYGLSFLVFVGENVYKLFYKLK